MAYAAIHRMTVTERSNIQLLQEVLWFLNKIINGYQCVVSSQEAKAIVGYRGTPLEFAALLDWLTLHDFIVDDGEFFRLTSTGADYLVKLGDLSVQLSDPLKKSS